MFSCEWNWRFWLLDPCQNCGANQWYKDWIFAKQSRGRARYVCFRCGEDIFPGGAVNEQIAKMLEADRVEQADKIMGRIADKIAGSSVGASSNAQVADNRPTAA